MCNNKKSFVAMKPLALDFFPGPMDVVCARGSAAHNHPGNRLFREKIRQNLAEYSQATSKHTKTMIVTSIVRKVRKDSPSGGFVKEEDEKWYEVGDHLAREKVGQCFRALLHSKQKPMIKKHHQKIEKKKMKLKNNDPHYEFTGKNYFDEMSNRIHLVSAKSSTDAEIQSMFNQANSNLLQALKDNVGIHFESSLREDFRF